LTGDDNPYYFDAVGTFYILYGVVWLSFSLNTAADAGVEK